MAAPSTLLPQLLAYPRPELFTARTPTSDLVKRLRPWAWRAGGLVAKTALLMLMTRAQFLVGELDPTFYN